MPTAIDRLVRKEVSLGAIRELPLPDEHIGLTQIAPFLDVETDDVIFEYIKDSYQDGLAPGRAEDAEAELAQKDDLSYGEGRASIVDWALKDKYSASDVSRFRDSLLLQQAIDGTISTQLSRDFVGRTVADFNARLARHDRLRRRKLDNRIEWLIMQAIENSSITYNDGKIKWTVNYNRPGGQQNQAPASGLWTPANSAAMDPIGDLLAVSQTMYDTYGVRPTRAITSRKVVNSLWRSQRFLAAVGVPVVGGTASLPLDPNYLGLAGYNPEGALALVQQVTGINFTIYDGVWRSRPIGSQTVTNNRFLSENKVFLLPSEGDLGEIDDTQLGFAKTLTAPHPEGNWQSGYYEWEDESKDPWMHVRGSGVKAFPVFPYMQYTYTMSVLA